MLNCGMPFIKGLCVGLMLASSVVPASAFDLSGSSSKNVGPFDHFKLGFKAYKSGDKDKAIEAYRYAADQGHTGSRWALANMYEFGDGVSKDDYEAFKIYSEIANQGVEPGSNDTGFFVNALLSLADYYRDGIPGSPVASDLGQARQLYFQVASTFGVPQAQFELAQMILAGQGGRADVQQAKKWLNQARKHGHAGAMSIFGNLLFQEGQTVRGLAFMTLAMDKCAPSDCLWIQNLQEQAFSIVGEEDRRVAIAVAQKIDKSGVE
jgi:TPR repeat protein